MQERIHRAVADLDGDVPVRAFAGDVLTGRCASVAHPGFSALQVELTDLCLSPMFPIMYHHFRSEIIGS